MKKQVEWCLPLVFLVLNELNVSIELMKLSLLMGGGVTWKDFVPRRGMGTFLFSDVEVDDSKTLFCEHEMINGSIYFALCIISIISIHSRLNG